jgi:hypothetical protein
MFGKTEYIRPHYHGNKTFSDLNASRLVSVPRGPVHLNYSICFFSLQGCESGNHGIRSFARSVHRSDRSQFADVGSWKVRQNFGRPRPNAGRQRHAVPDSGNENLIMIFCF